MSISVKKMGGAKVEVPLGDTVGHPDPHAGTLARSHARTHTRTL